MRSAIQLQIAEPCHQDWQKMTTEEKGRFCGSCQKTVIDFSNMSDKQVLDYFKNYKGDTCGRFDNRQLERPLVSAGRRKPGWINWAVASVLSSLVMFSKAKAQVNTVKIGKVAIKNAPKEMPAQIKTPIVKSNFIVIEGTVTDENGAGIPFASVMVKGEDWGGSADSLGNYKLTVVTKQDSIMLVCSAVGFAPVEKPASIKGIKSLSEHFQLNLNSKLDEVVVFGIRCSLVMGQVSTGRTTHRKLIPQKQKDNALGVSWNLFPNPAKAGTAVQLAVQKPGVFGWRLLDASGKIILTKSASHVQAGQTLPVKIPGNIAAGQYFVQVLDADGKSEATINLLVD